MPECPNCKHKHDFWDAKLMKRTHTNTEKFIEINGCTHQSEDYAGRFQLKEVKMFGCPKCYIVFWDENW